MKCPRCQVDKPEVAFIKEGSLYSQCHGCRDKDRVYRRNKKANIIPPKVLLRQRREEAVQKDNYVCSTCGQEKPLSEFPSNATNSVIFGISGCCKSCRKYTDKFSKIKGQYKLSKEEFLNLIESQNGKCKICQIDMETFSFKNNMSNTLCVDHCHETGKVRGLLCNNCNRALGLFGDNEDVLNRAYNYIVQFKSGELREYPEVDNPEPS